MLTTLTAVQRLEMQAKAAEKRELDKAFAEKHLRNDFTDIHSWRRLAAKYGVRMPSWYVRNTRTIRRALRTVGLDGSWVTEVTGHVSLKDLMDANPSWPSYAFIGLVLESAHERDGQEDLPEVDDEDDLIGSEDDDDAEEPEEESDLDDLI